MQLPQCVHDSLATTPRLALSWPLSVSALGIPTTATLGRPLLHVAHRQQLSNEMNKNCGTICKTKLLKWCRCSKKMTLQWRKGFSSGDLDLPPVDRAAREGPGRRWRDGLHFGCLERWLQVNISSLGCLKQPGGVGGAASNTSDLHCQHESVS